MRRFEGKSAVVMTGTFGVGHEVARALAAEGAQVAVLGVNEQNGRATADALHAMGARTMFMRTDSMREGDVRHACETVRKEWGRIDVAIGCNDHHAAGLLHETSLEEFELTMSFNARSAFYLAKHTLPEMEKAGGGAAVFLSSMYSFVAGSVSAAYEASMAVTNGFVRSAGERYARANVRVNAVAAGHARGRERGLSTEFGGSLVMDDAEAARLGHFYPSGRIGSVDEIVRAMLFLASDEASFVSGVTMPVDGGFLLR